MLLELTSFDVCDSFETTSKTCTDYARKDECFPFSNFEECPHGHLSRGAGSPCELCYTTDSPEKREIWPNSLKNGPIVFRERAQTSEIICGSRYSCEDQKKIIDALWCEAENYTKKRLSMRTILRFWNPKTGVDMRLSLKNMIKFLLNNNYIAWYEKLYNTRILTPLGRNCTLCENIMYDLTPTTVLRD